MATFRQKKKDFPPNLAQLLLTLTNESCRKVKKFSSWDFKRGRRSEERGRGEELTGCEKRWGFMGLICEPMRKEFQREHSTMGVLKIVIDLA